jgi:hypothetical protein
LPSIPSKSSVTFFFESTPAKAPYPPSPLSRGSLREGRGLQTSPLIRGGTEGVGFKWHLLLIPQEQVVYLSAVWCGT